MCVLFMCNLFLFVFLTFSMIYNSENYRVSCFLSISALCNVLLCLVHPISSLVSCVHLFHVLFVVSCTSESYFLFHIYFIIPFFYFFIVDYLHLMLPYVLTPAFDNDYDSWIRQNKAHLPASFTSFEKFASYLHISRLDVKLRSKFGYPQK